MTTTESTLIALALTGAVAGLVVLALRRDQTKQLPSVIDDVPIPRPRPIPVPQPVASPGNRRQPRGVWQAPPQQQQAPTVPNQPAAAPGTEHFVQAVEVGSAYTKAFTPVTAGTLTVQVTAKNAMGQTLLAEAIPLSIRTDGTLVSSAARTAGPSWALAFTIQGTNALALEVRHTSGVAAAAIDMTLSW